VAKCITIRGSFVGTREDMAETLAFAAEGKVKADIELQPLSRSTASSIGWSMAMWRHEWCSILVD
jgi:D-arabinose 1-dehydrogenase-like Zn-dependent alcohol dehydrogenase